MTLTEFLLLVIVCLLVYMSGLGEVVAGAAEGIFRGGLVLGTALGFGALSLGITQLAYELDGNVPLALLSIPAFLLGLKATARVHRAMFGGEPSEVEKMTLSQLAIDFAKGFSPLVFVALLLLPAGLLIALTIKAYEFGGGAAAAMVGALSIVSLTWGSFRAARLITAKLETRKHA